MDRGSSGLASPDGSRIAFMGRFTSAYLGTTYLDTAYLGGFRELWVMGPGGEEPRKIFTSEERELLLGAAWSPDGSRLAYLRVRLGSPDAVIAFAFAAVESLDLKSNKATTLVSDPQMAGGFCWSPRGRIVYSRREPSPNSQDSNLWEVEVNSITGEAASKPNRITRSFGTAVLTANASADGSHLAVVKANFQSDVYIGQLEANRTRMKTPRRLTLDERNDRPGPWMPDSKSVIFSSDRNGNYDIFEQAIDQSLAVPLVTGPDDEFPKAVTSDGQWLLYSSQKQGDASAQARLMRVPMSGGTPEPLLAAGLDFYDFGCAKQPPSTLCVLAKKNELGMSFTAYDLGSRKIRELATVEHALDFDIFQDGSRIAVLINEKGKSRIRILRASGQTEREFAVDRPGIMEVYCTSDGSGLYLGSTSQPGIFTLLSTDLRGASSVMWQQNGSFGFWLYPSPDGRYLSITKITAAKDAWLLENF